MEASLLPYKLLGVCTSTYGATLVLVCNYVSGHP